MARRCTICAHPERTAVETAIAGGASLRSIAHQFHTTHTALARHRDGCGALAVDQTRRQADETRQATVREQLADLQGRTMALLAKAERADELKAALLAIRTARENLTLLAKLTGELDERPEINVLVHPQWIEVRTAILGALQPHPAAMEAVGRALADIDAAG